MRKTARVILVILVLAIGFIAGFGYGRWYGPMSESKAPTPKAARYHCPMHPNYTSDEPGNCPVCGMKLVPIPDASAPPEIAGHEHTGEPATMPPNAFHVSPEKQQLIGVTYGVAEASPATRSFRALGKVMMDETRLAKVQTRVEGWIDQVYIDFTGKQVEKGQPLLTLYSPEMLASQQEFLLALRSREILKSSPLAISRNHSESLIAAARKRLELWELSDEQIGEIERTEKPLTQITLYSPISGYVMARNAYPKQRITPETELYTLADLSHIWIVADVFENDAPLVHIGTPAQVKLSNIAGRAIPARVSYIQPQVDPTSRTLKIRLEADNPTLALKPDMFADVDFQVHLGQRLTVPEPAVLDSGITKRVYVSLGNGYLEPRIVETGERAGGRVEITRGLKAGEQVVTSGNFLIDSESQLRSPGQSTSGGAHQHGGPPPAPANPKRGSEHQHD